MHKLLVFQPLWGMQRLLGQTKEPSLEDKIAQIAEAGFDGVTDHFAHVATLMALLREHGLAIEGQVFHAQLPTLHPRWRWPESLVVITSPFRRCPAPYAITGPDGADLTDRWAEALFLKNQIRHLWASTAQP